MLPVIGMSDADARYLALNCDIRYIEPSEEIMSYISHKVVTTKASNHSFSLKVVNAFEVNMKNAPAMTYSVGNVRRLFHGSRSANIVGILSSYLKLPTHLTSGIVQTSQWFGNGIYFAENSTKSANYSFSNLGKANKYSTGFLFIAEVALGKVHDVYVPTSFSKPPVGYNSIMGRKGQRLVNNEFIVYDPSQVRVRYLVEVEKC